MPSEDSLRDVFGDIRDFSEKIKVLKYLFQKLLFHDQKLSPWNVSVAIAPLRVWTSAILAINDITVRVNIQDLCSVRTVSREHGR